MCCGRLLSPHAARTKEVCCWEVPGSKLVLAPTESCRHMVSACECTFAFVTGLLGLCQAMAKRLRVTGTVPRDCTGTGTVHRDCTGTGTVPRDYTGTGTVPRDRSRTGTVPIDRAGTGTVPRDRSGIGTVTRDSHMDRYRAQRVQNDEGDF